jgi:thioredoxin 1
VADSDKIKELTDSNFQAEVLEADAPVVVDFRADWCGPCKMIEPIMIDLATQYENEVIFGQIDVDSHQKVVTRYGIRSIPTLLFFKNGEIVHQIVGVTSKNSLVSKVEELIG